MNKEVKQEETKRLNILFEVYWWDIEEKCIYDPVGSSYTLMDALDLFQHELNNCYKDMDFKTELVLSIALFDWIDNCELTDLPILKINPCYIYADKKMEKELTENLAQYFKNYWKERFNKELTDEQIYRK